MRSRRTALTLIEVLAAMALLGGTLAAVVVAAGRHTQQVRSAQDRIEATDAADRLLSSWLVDAGGQIPAPAGPVPGRAGWRWRVSGRIEPDLLPLGCHVGRLEIHGEGDGPPLAAVEFVSNSVHSAGAGDRR